MARGTKATARPLKATVKVTKSVEKRPQTLRKGSFNLSKEPTGQISSEEEDAPANGNIFGPKTFKGPRRSTLIAHDGSTGSISPSLATFYPDRKFSLLYGHGHPLEHAMTSTPSVTGQKRKASDLVEEVSPKRVHFTTSNNEAELRSYDCEMEAPIYEDLSIARRDLALDADFLTQEGCYLLTALSDVTETLSIHEISSLFRILQKLTGDFAATFFAETAQDNNELVGQDMQKFPLADLELKHHALYLTAVNVLDASTTDQIETQPHIKNTGWLKFFAHPNYRPFLVTAILSEWFTQRIFKDTAFGLSDKARKDMEENVDKQYIYFDAFIRAKRRSAIVARYRNQRDAEFWLEKASADLADELMIVLAPMMPFFQTSDPYNENLSPEDADQKDEIWVALVELIRHCAALNLAVVRSGENGTIVRPASKLEKGRRYYSTAPMECINPEMCDMARDDAEAGKDKEMVIKMACWPRMEAWVPRGLDKLEMSIAEYDERLKQLPVYLKTKIQRGDRLTAEELNEARKGFCWDRTEIEKYWDVLPVELWDVDKKNRQKQDMLRKSHGAEMNFQRAQRKKNGGDDDSDASDSDSSSSTDSDSASSESDNDRVTDFAEKDEDGPRGSWVTEYTCLAPHMVYCEWVKPQPVTREPAKPTNSLQDAVRDARKDLALPHALVIDTDDLLLKLWNFYASHNLAIEWSTFLVAVLVYISRRGVPANAINMVTLPFKITAYILDGICEILGVKALSRGAFSLASNMAHGIPAAGPGLQHEQFVVPDHILDGANTYLDNNLNVFKTVLWNVVAPLKGAFSTTTEQGTISRSDGFASMTHFIGQRKPFTTNPISRVAGLKSVVSSAVSSVVPQPSRTLGPAAAASLASAAAAFSASITPPPAVTIPVEVVTEVEPSETWETVTETKTVFAAPVTVMDTKHPTPGVWYNAASKAANVAGDFFFGTLKGRKTVSLEPGQTYTKMMAHEDYEVV